MKKELNVCVRVHTFMDILLLWIELCPLKLTH